MTSLGALYLETRRKLRDVSPTPELDAKLLMSYALGCAPDDVILKPDTPLEANAVLDDAIARRLRHEPVAKITGTRDFYGLRFTVSRDVLDPRPDTETLIDAVRPYIKENTRILDLCTGSGCILATLLHLYPDASGVATDISTAALRIAEENFTHLGVRDRVQTIESDYLESVSGTFDLIVCNPPYIESSAIESLDADVRLYDPILALDGGDDGLAPYRTLFPQIRNHMKKDAHAAFEIGFTQRPDVARLAENVGLQVIAVRRDLGNHERVVILK